MIKASFKNIQNQIHHEIERSKDEILIAVAWFTNKELFGLLTEKLSEEIQIKLLISDDRINKKLIIINLLNLEEI